MVTRHGVRLAQSAHARVRIVEVVRHLDVSNHPHGALHHVSCEDCELPLWHEGLDGGVHALLERQRSVAVDVAVRAGGGGIVAWLVSSCVAAAADILSTVPACADRIVQIDVDVANMHHLYWRLATGCGTQGRRLGGHGWRI